MKKENRTIEFKAPPDDDQLLADSMKDESLMALWRTLKDVNEVRSGAQSEPPAAITTRIMAEAQQANRRQALRFSDLQLHNREEQQEVPHDIRRAVRPVIANQTQTGMAPSWVAGRLRIILPITWMATAAAAAVVVLLFIIPTLVKEPLPVAAPGQLTGSQHQDQTPSDMTSMGLVWIDNDLDQGISDLDVDLEIGSLLFGSDKENETEDQILNDLVKNATQLLSS